MFNAPVAVSRETSETHAQTRLSRGLAAILHGDRTFCSGGNFPLHTSV